MDGRKLTIEQKMVVVDLSVCLILLFVFDHLNFLVRNVCHVSLLWHVLPQQAIEVLVGATLPTGKGSGKVARATQCFINLGVPAKFFAVVIGQGLDPSLQRVERLDDRRAN